MIVLPFNITYKKVVELISRGYRIRHTSSDNTSYFIDARRIGSPSSDMQYFVANKNNEVPGLWILYTSEERCNREKEEKAHADTFTTL